MKNFVIFCLACTLTSCINDVKFDRPQPEGETDEVFIPFKIWGIYRSTHDSSLLFISSSEIVRYVNKDFVVPKTILDSAYQIKGDSSFYDEENKMRIEVRGDSVYGSFRRTDTIFNISPMNVLRKYRGYYFLNKEVHPDSWNVYLLKAGGSEISIITTWTDSDLAALRKIMHVGDSVNHFKPTRSQLRKFLMQHGLPEGEKFVRVVAGDVSSEWDKLTVGL